jgi:flagellar hook-associated protein 3 FlgL
MPSISNTGQALHMRSLLASLRGKISTTQEQTVTGLKAGDFGGLGSAAMGSLSLRAQLSRIDAYQTSIDHVVPRTEIMSQSMEKIAQVAREIIAETNKYGRNEAAPVALVNDAAGNALSIVQQQLNSQIGGRYLFAGTDVDTAPVADPTAIATSLATVMTDFAAGTATADDVITAAAAVTGAGLGYSAALATTGNVIIRADDDYDLDYTVLADTPGFQDIVRGLSILQNAQSTPANSDEFWNLVDRATALLDQGSRRVDQDNAKLGAKMRILEDVAIRHEQSMGLAEKFLGDVEEVDVAEAITRLQTLQTQLQAAYESMSMLRELSLVNYLR